MKKLFILFAFQSTMLNISYPQNTFLKQIDVSNRDKGMYVCQTNDGGYILTGVINYTYDTSDIVLVRTNPVGETLWIKIYGGDYLEDAYCVRETSDNGFIISGMRRYGTNDDRAFIIKTNSSGDTIWTKIFEGVYKTVIQMHDSCFVLVGKQSHAALLKIDNMGNLLWSKNYSYCKEFSDCLEISGNRIVIGGLSKSWDPPYSTTIDLLLADAEGDSIWFKQYGGIYSYYELCVKQTLDKGFVLSATESIIMEYPDIYLQKVDSSGNYQWAYTFGTQYYSDIAKSVVQTSDSGFIITGDSDDYGLFLLKTDKNGNFLWEKGYDYDSYMTFGNCIQNTMDDHLIITGSTWHKYPPPQWDILLIKTDNNGIITDILEPSEGSRHSSIVYPNPNNGTFSLRLSTNDKNVQILDIKGQVIYNKTLDVNKSEILRIENLNKGCYLIGVTSADNIKIEKILVH